MAKQYKNYVNGEWKTSENSITIYAPANGEELGSVPAMSQAEVDEVYAAAKAALPAWRALSYAERAAYLHKAADILERDAEKIGQVLSKEISKGLKSAIGEVVRTAEIIHYAAEEGLRLEGEVLEGGAFDAGSKKKIAVVRREPVGLVLAISPFNYPVNLAGSKIAPALIAGDVVAFKPPTQGSISGLLLVEAFVEAGIPAGVLNSITGRGSVIGDYIVEHKAVDFINFTGSTPVGENIGRLAAMRPIMLELGGKDAAIVLEDADLDLDKADLDRCGTVVGTGIGGIDSIHEVYETLFDKGPGRVSPFAVPMMIANMTSARVSIRLGLKGPVITDVTACTSGTNAIGDAFRIIQRGDADVMFAGGTEAAVSPAAVAGFAAMKAMSTRNDEPTKASRPFDRDRDGFVMGEGSGIVVLEELEHAKARGAHIYAEVVGYGSNGDAYHITAPAPGGVQARKCMELAIKDAGIDPKDVNYINAHGTSTGLNDQNETLAIKELFGDHAKNIAVNSTKSMTGHLLGAAGAIETIVMAMAIETGKVHPTINCDNPDEGLDLDYVREGARELQVKCALSNSFGFGGHNGTLCIRRYEA